VGSVFARRRVTVAPGGKGAEHLTALGVYFRFGPEGVQKHLDFRIVLQGTAGKKASGCGNGTSDAGKCLRRFEFFEKEGKAPGKQQKKPLKKPVTSK
jgi:hypothetical protein